MWILITFAIIALVLFLVMTILRIEPLISIVVSVLTAIILSYFIDRLTLTVTYSDKDPKLNGTATVSTSGSVPSNTPTTNIQSSASNSASNSNSSSFGFFQTGK